MINALSTKFSNGMPALDGFVKKLTTPAGAAFLYPEARPQVLIVSPRPKPGSDYTTFIDDLEVTVQDIMRGTGATFKRTTYTRAQDTPAGSAVWDLSKAPGNANLWNAWLDTQPLGKVVARYAPTGGHNNQKAYAVYVGDNPIVQIHDEW